VQPPGAEDELDLALVEAQQLQQGMDVQQRRARQLLSALERDRARGLLRICRAPLAFARRGDGAHYEKCYRKSIPAMPDSSLSTVMSMEPMT
jgi:hypothetical protein